MWARPWVRNGTRPILLRVATIAEPRTGDLIRHTRRAWSTRLLRRRVDLPQLVLLHDPQVGATLQDAAAVSAVGARPFPHAPVDRAVEGHPPAGDQADAHQLAGPLPVALAVAEPAHPGGPPEHGDALGHQVATRLGQPDPAAHALVVAVVGQLLAGVRRLVAAHVLHGRCRGTAPLTAVRATAPRLAGAASGRPRHPRPSTSRSTTRTIPRPRVSIRVTLTPLRATRPGNGNRHGVGAPYLRTRPIGPGPAWAN